MQAGKQKSQKRARSNKAKSIVSADSRANDFDHEEDPQFEYTPKKQVLVQNFELKEDHAQRPIWITDDPHV